MANGHCFISYSPADALDFARRLADELAGGDDAFIKTWLDKRDIDPARDWDDQIVDGIRSCKCMLFVMTRDSTAPGSMCKNEWCWALKYKKPVVPIRLHTDVEQPFGLCNRQWLDFTGDFDHSLARLRLFLRRLDAPAGQLDALKDRLTDAQRDLRRARPEEQARIQADLDELNRQIAIQEKIVANPKAAAEQTQKNISTGLAREHQSEKAVTKTTTKFINPPPGIAPNYFQDRYQETREVVRFLKDASQRLLTIVGRGGVGKTAIVCRLLKQLESGALPDDLGAMTVAGIVYLSETGSHRASFANIFYDLCQLLPAGDAAALDAIYRNPQASTGSKMAALLEKFTNGPVVLLLDNFEPLVDPETLAIRDAELDEALRAFLSGSHTAVTIIITTRVAPRALNLVQPGRQRLLILDEGLDSPYAENILREMDSDGRLGLQTAPDDLLSRARERTRGYPRALEALFAILASDRYTTLAEVLALPMPENVVEVLVGEAFSRLDPAAQKVMQALAVYNRPVAPAAVDYLLAPHLPAIDSAPILQRLANMHFSRKESGRFYLHPVDRDYAYQLIPASESGKASEKAGPHAEDAALFSQQALLTLAADYFKQARKLRPHWKKLDDLAAQLAEFDLRCIAGDYDTATRVLRDIDFDYLLLWGHFRLIIDLHLRVKDKITDENLRLENLNGLGLSHYSTGKIKEAIDFYKQGLAVARKVQNRGGEGTFLGNLGIAHADLGDSRQVIGYLEQALAIAREIGDRRSEGNRLGSLVIAYADLGDARQAIVYYEQALAIAREIGNRRSEGAALSNLGLAMMDLKDEEKCRENLSQAMQIADEISYPELQQGARWGLAQEYLLQNDLVNARATIEAALQYDVPRSNYNATALHGIIVLRQGEVSTANQAFGRAIAQAHEILAQSPDYYDALDSRGLALAGAALCAAEPNQRTEAITTAIDSFTRARTIAPHAGLVKRVLRLFDELVKCDAEGVLSAVRQAAAGI